MFHFIKHRTLSRFFILFAFLTLSACSFHIKITKDAELDERDGKDTILVVGYLDDSEAPFTMGWGDIKQVRPATEEPYKELRSNKEGLFYLENLPLGSYKLISLDGREKGPLSTQPWTVSLPDPSRDKAFKRTEFRAKTPGVYFMGSYKLKLVKKGGFFGRDKFETMVLNKPTEKEVLKMLLKHAKGTRWTKVIKKRMGQLKK